MKSIHSETKSPRVGLGNLSHHAYYLSGNGSLSGELISILEKTHKIKTKGNPDFFEKKYETFTIDEARELKSLAETMPVIEGGKKIFILSMNGITVEAQNALLKLLEEPAEYAKFFLILPSAHLLLPTVKSRLSLIESASPQVRKSASDGELRKQAESFLSMSAAKRLDMIKKLMEDVSKEKKTKQEVIDFLNEVQASVYDEKGVKEGKSALEAIEVARKYLNDRAPSLKMLLEYAALSI